MLSRRSVFAVTSHCSCHRSSMICPDSWWDQLVQCPYLQDFPDVPGKQTPRWTVCKACREGGRAGHRGNRRREEGQRRGRGCVRCVDPIRVGTPPVMFSGCLPLCTSPVACLTVGAPGKAHIPRMSMWGGGQPGCRDATPKSLAPWGPALT